MKTPHIIIKPTVEYYARCQFCNSFSNLYDLQGSSSQVVTTICKDCIDKLSKV